MANYPPEKMREYIAAYRRRLLDEAIERLGGLCVRCGTAEALQFDHIDPATKVFVIANGWKKKRDLFWAEVAKCQLLCHRCHSIKTCADHGWKSRYANSP